MFENLDRRKIIVIAVIVAVVGAIVWLTIIAFRKPVLPPQGNENVNQPSGFPPISNGNANVGVNGNLNLPFVNGNTNGNVPVNGNQPVTTPPVIGSPIAAGGQTAAPALTQSGILAPSGSTGSNARYYDSNDCKFYQLSENGTREPLGQATYCQVQTVTWAPSNSRAILEFPDGANILYDFAGQKQYTLPKDMTEFSFSPDGGKVVGKFLADNPADRWITSVNPDGSGLTPIEPMGENADKVQVAWSPNNQVVALSTTGEPAGLFQQEVLLIGFNGENFRSLRVDGRGFQAKWSGDGSRLLYSVYSDATNYRPGLWLTDGSTDRVGANTRQLSLATWADKCSVAGSEAFCAVPRDLPDGSGFSRELARGLPDDIYRVDLSGGATTLIAQPVGEGGIQLSATNLTLSADGRFLYFTDGNGVLRNVQLRP